MNPPASSAAPQIVHESETQRQHVRLPLPARAEIAGQVCAVKDLSPGGLAVRDLAGSFARGQRLPLRLMLPFGSFSMDISLEAEIQHFNSAAKTAGLRFVDLVADQIALLNHILRAYMAGDVVRAGDVMNVVTRENFVKARRQNAAAPVGPDLGRQLPRLAAVLSIGLIVTAFMLGNMYEKIFVLKTANAAVGGPLVDVPALREGIYKTVLSPDAASVKTGDPLGEIRNAAGDVTQRVTAPCDCYIVGNDAFDGSYVAAGAPLVTLIPIEAKPWITAVLDPALAGRLEIGDSATINIAGSDIAFTGQVAAIESPLAANRTVPLAYGAQALPASIRILTDQRIPVDMTNRPARVIFNTR